MMANAAGPIMIIYFVAMQLPKVAFVGTSAWFFFVVNWLKVPFSTSLKLMTAESIKLNLMMIPVIAVGAVVGHRLPQTHPSEGLQHHRPGPGRRRRDQAAVLTRQRGPLQRKGFEKGPAKDHD